jgi:hypothetical protein
VASANQASGSASLPWHAPALSLLHELLTDTFCPPSVRLARELPHRITDRLRVAAFPSRTWTPATSVRASWLGVIMSCHTVSDHATTASTLAAGSSDALNAPPSTCCAPAKPRRHAGTGTGDPVDREARNTAGPPRRCCCRSPPAAPQAQIPARSRTAPAQRRQPLRCNADPWLP